MNEERGFCRLMPNCTAAIEIAAPRWPLHKTGSFFEWPPEHSGLTVPPSFREEDATDMKSRHKGKLHTEQLLAERDVNYTSIRPVYIYGPLNYNPVEEFFFHRLSTGRPVCVPNSGMQVTQLGHVKDLADAFVKCLGNAAASQQIYNISGACWGVLGLALRLTPSRGATSPSLLGRCRLP
jgi:nucleoside-diphosphate-sugar epimerase